LFAVGLGALFLGERLTLFKVILTAMIFCGVLVLRLS
jgi:drug/metabolite transporter (DMT)-like permease